MLSQQVRRYWDGMGWDGMEWMVRSDVRLLDPRNYKKKKKNSTPLSPSYNCASNVWANSTGSSSRYVLMYGGCMALAAGTFSSNIFPLYSLSLKIASSLNDNVFWPNGPKNWRREQDTSKAAEHTPPPKIEHHHQSVSYTELHTAHCTLILLRRSKPCGHCMYVGR